MSSTEHQEKMKEEAKAIRTRLETLIKDTDPLDRIRRTVMIYAGLITETLLEYEEPDVVMEQAFHRIADLLETDPADDMGDLGMPPAYIIDRDTEVGRHLGRNVADNLPKGMDDLHEIAIALVIADFPLWSDTAVTKEYALRLLIESVISSLTFEMATQDFCDLLIEDFMTEAGRTSSDGLLALSAMAGYYFQAAKNETVLLPDAEQELTNVMARESLRHGTPGLKNWSPLAAANDSERSDVPGFIEELKPDIEEFFALIGLEDALSKAVAVAKAVGRMVAVITVEDIGQVHPSIAKSLAKTGMILGGKYMGEAESPPGKAND